MICTKEQIVKEIHDMLAQLDKEHLVFLYNSEFINLAKGFKIVKLVKNDIFELNLSKKIEPSVLVNYITSKLSENNQNHNSVVIYNILVKGKKLKYLEENKFELIENKKLKEI